MPLGHATRSDPRWAGKDGDLAPTAFNPERYVQQPGAAKSDHYMPFGHGPR